MLTVNLLLVAIMQLPCVSCTQRLLAIAELLTVPDRVTVPDAARVDGLTDPEPDRSVPELCDVASARTTLIDTDPFVGVGVRIIPIAAVIG